jgi:hypothetical protein
VSRAAVEREDAASAASHVQTTRSTRAAIADALLPLAVAAFYVAFAVVHAIVVNTDVTRHDQST